MFKCEKCSGTSSSVIYKDTIRMCHSCYNDLLGGGANKAPSVHGDECDVWIKHGVCNPDGSPKRYRSKAEIKQAAFNAGLFQGGDTPKVNHRLLEERAKTNSGR